MVFVVDSATRPSEIGDELGAGMALLKVCATTGARCELGLVSVSDRALGFESSELVKRPVNDSSSVLYALRVCVVGKWNYRDDVWEVLDGFQLEQCDPPQYFQLVENPRVDLYALSGKKTSDG